MGPLVITNICEQFAVDGEDAGLSDEANETVVVVHHRERPGTGAFEDLDDVLHLVVSEETRGRFHHQLTDSEALVELGAEHDVTDVIDVQHCHQLALGIEDGKDVVLRGGDLLDDLTQRHLGSEELAVAVDDGVDGHQRQYGPVLVVGEQLATTCQTHGIDAVRLEDVDGEVGTDGDNHQRHEELIASREFGNEEDSRQGRMHDTTHESAHAQKGEVVLCQMDAEETSMVPHLREDETEDASQEQRGGKDSTASPSPIRGSGGKDLEDDDEGKIDEKHVVVAIEDGVVHRRQPVLFAVAGKQEFDEVVTFTVERREEEDEDRQHGASHGETEIGMLQLAEEALEEVHGAGEIQRHQTTADAQQDIGRDADGREDVFVMEVEHGVDASDGECHRCRRHAGYQQGQKRTHGKVNHQHLEHKGQTRYGRLEDACHSTGSTTAHEEHQLLGIEAEHATQVAADGRTREDDRSLGTDRSTKTDGDGRSYETAPAVVGLDVALLTGKGKENLCHAVADVVPHYPTNEDGGEEDTDYGIDEIEPVGRGVAELVGQQVLDVGNEPL